MAVKNCEELSNIISLGIVSGDEDLAKEIARLSEKKKQALVRAGKLGEGEEVDALTGWTAHELELKANSADIEMRAIVQAKILTNDVRVGDAYRELAEQIRKTGGTISSGVELLEKLRNASPADYKSIAQQWGGQYAKDPERAIKEMQEAIAETVSANYSIRQYSEIKSRGLEKLRKQLRDKEISQGIFEDEVKKLHKDAMEAIAKGENPKDFAKLDDEWASIKKIFGDNPLKAGKVWSQFIMARELLSDGAIDDGVLKAFADMGAENLTGPLTIDQIAKYGKDDLDKLLARAYTNTEQLYKDGNLRQVYREKLIELTSGMRVSKENIKKAQSIMNTMEFAEKGAAFSDVVTADNAVRSANKRGIKVKDGTQLIWGIKKFAEKLGEDPNILKEPIKIAGAEFKPIDLIQIIYDITGDENILKLLRLGFLSDSVILSVGTSRLLGGTKEAAERLLKIFSKAKEMPKVSSVRDISLKAITGIDIKEGAPMGFFDFRTPLYKKDKLNRSKADLYDKLANKNKMRVDSTNITYIQGTDDVNTLVTELKKYKGGYVIVNDSQFRANDVLSQALDIVNDGLKDEEKVWALFPRGGNSSSFIMEDGQLYFKTLYDDIFDDVAGTISIQSLGEAKPTREILATAYEAATGKNGDKIRYQASYSKGGADNLGRQISDQQVERFSESEIRDENGYLLTMYHGTNSDFSIFDYDKIGKGKGLNEGPGFYFSSDPYKAGGYGGRQIEVYLDIRNPFHLDGKNKSKLYIDDIRAVARDLLDSNKMTQNGYDEMMSYLDNYAQFIKKGEDGREYIDSSVTGFILEIGHRYRRNAVGVTNGLASWEGWLESFSRISGYDGFVNHSSGDRIYTAVAFSQNQIKSVDNRLPTADPNMHFMERSLSPQAERSAIDAWNTRVKAARESGDYSWADDYQLIKDYYDNMKNFLSQFEPSELEKIKKYSKVWKNVSDVEGRAKKNGIAVEYLTAFTELIPLDVIHNSKIFTDISFPKYYEAVGDGAKYAYNIDDVALRGGFTGLPTSNPNMHFMKMDSRTGIDSLEGLRDYILPKVTFDGKDIHKATSSINGYDAALFELLYAVTFMGKGRNGDFKEAFALAERRLKDKYSPETADYYIKKLSKIDTSKISIDDKIKTPTEIAEAIFDYSFGSLDKSRIGNVISKNGRVNRKVFNKLSHDEQIEIVNRLLQFDELYYTRYAIDKIIGGDAQYDGKLVEVGNKLIDDYGLNPYIQRGITSDVKLDDFIGAYTDRGYLPHEVGIYTDGNNNVLSVTVGTSSVNWGSEQQRFTIKGVPNSKYFHNHPNGSFFSKADLDNENTASILGLILPGGVVLEFPNNEEFRELYKKFYHSRFVPREDGVNRTTTLFEDSIFAALRISQEMGIVGKQDRGRFAEIINNGSSVALNDETKKRISNEVLEIYYDMENWAIDSLTPEGAVDPVWMRRTGQYADQADVTAEDAMKVQLFTKDRTWAQIAEAYGFPVRIVQGNMIEGTAAYGAWGNGMIYFTDMVKESTAPHELFHAVFNTYVGKEQYDRVLADATKLFQVSAYDAEEILADSFAEWFKTGKFTYGDKIKAITGKNKLTKEQKTFLQRVKDFFEDLAETLGLVDRHRAEVEQMFNDIVNCNYLPNVGKNVDATAAMIKYNDELDATAARYFGEMLGEDIPENIDREYIDRIQTKLSERLGIDIKAFSEIQDKSALWRKIDQQFALDKITTGKYDRQVVDINSVKNEIAGYTDDELEKAIKKDLGDVLIRGTIKGNNNIDHIREAYLDYKMAGTATDSLMAKGKIVSLANGGTAQTMSMQDIRDMFTNGNFKDTYKRMFLSNQTLTDKEMNKFVNAINDNIFDTLSITFAENLVAAGYSLPLINIKTFIYDYLRGNLDLNNKFVEAFLYKNKIPFTSDGLKSIVDSLMPTSFKFDYEDALFKGRFGEAEQGQATVVKETKNRFLQDSYSAIASIEMARAGNMPVNQEEEILKNILDKYIKEVSDGVKAGTLTFQQSQGLKQEAGYALDMFEQDFLLPRYGRFLSKQEKEGLIGMKYLLPIGVKGQNIDELNKELVSIRNKIVNKYETTLGGVARNNDINMSIARGLTSDDEVMQEAIDRRRDQLMNNGGVIKEVNGQYLVYDVKEALALTIAQMPKNVGLSETIIGLGRDGIEGLSNRQAYALLRYLEAAKGLNATANLATELIYKQNPALLRYNFFQSYRVGADGIPMALEGNLLTSDKFLSKFDNIGGLDTTAKKNIFDGIVSKFRSQGYLTKADLDNIIDKGISDAQASFRQVKFSPKDVKQATNNMKLIYKKVFEPYVHVRDIPKGGTLIDGRTKVTNVKAKVAEAMRQQYNQAVNDLKAMGVDDFTDLNDAIYITTSNGDKISLREAGEMSIDSWKKDIFNDESVFVAGADELKKFEGSPDDEALVKRQKVWRESIISQYDSNLQAMLNQTQYISKAEADLSTAFMNDVRTTMRQSTLTNKIVDALDALSGLNEEAARGIKDYLIGWRGNMTFGKWTSGQILKRNELVKEAYKKYYYLDISKLNSVVPTTKAEDLALRLAKYFKNLERLLGSADGLTGCTTSQQLNRAFYHIGETVINVDTVKGVFGLLSGVEQNQILKFFKFAKGDLRKQADIFIRSGKGSFQEGFGGYRDYAEDISGISREEFNQIFASNFSENDFKRILQGLTGFSLTGAWGRMGMRILNILNSSNFLFRFLMSYPGQLLTIPQQSLAYFLKQIGFEREMGVESMSEVDSVRAHYGILDGAYNELGRWGKSTVSPDDIRLDSYYNRYGIPDVDEIYKTSSIETSDDYINMYAKIDQHAASSVSATSKWFRQLDPYKDNANNIIDGLFARNFKNISFLKALRGNDFLQFGSAKEFMSFMDDPTISAEVKTRLMDRVASYSGRNFRNILGLGFGGIDRAVAGGGFGNIMYGLMQLFNFRGSWGQNIFKQTGANMFTALKMLAKGRWSDKGKAAIAEYIARQPEFTNFIGALFNDLRWTWKLQRFQDNGRWPDDNSFYDAMDFIEYMTDTLNMTSQRWQGLQSFGPLRPILEWGGSAFMSAMNPTIYKDTFGVGAFINALGKNVGRQWKPYNWIVKWIGAWRTDGPEGAMAYLESEWWKLSFGSLRFMVNEDMNAYGYTYEITGQTGGIPSILMGESRLGSDKNFSYEIDNSETWESLRQVFDSDIPWDDRWTYLGNIGKAFVNGSQLMSMPKNVRQAYKRESPSYFTADNLSEYIQKTDAGLEFYRRGIVTPKTPQEAKIFFDTMLANSQYRPGSSSFTKSLINYENYGHMDGKKGKKADAQMELWLDHMKHLTNKNGEFETSGGQKVVDPSWNKLIEDVKIHGYNQTYTTKLIYNYAKNWLNNHSSDPNYQLYIKMLGQGQAHNLIENKTEQLLEVLNYGRKKADNRWTETEFGNVGLDINLLLRLGNSKIEGENVTLFDKLQVLDEDDATVAALQIIKDQSKGDDRKVLDRFFDVEEQEDGSKVITLKYNYEQTLKQIGAVAKALDSGDVDLALAEASTLTNMYKQADPTGAVTATIIDSIYNRVYDSDTLTPSQKQAIMTSLFHKNKDFIQRNPEKLREILGDSYNMYADYMNSMLYQWDSMTISNLESMQSSGDSSSGKAKSAGDLSSAFKKLANEIGGGQSNAGTRSTGSYKEWVPVVIKGADLVKELGLKGYTPEVNDLKIQSYKPHSDFSLAKDINRSVKGPKTQAVTKKKQLSKLETDVENALEAES